MIRKRKYRKFTMVILIFILLIGNFTPYASIVGMGNIKASADSLNLFNNGDFETGDLTGWDTGGNSKFTVTDEEAHSGDYALEVSGPQNWNGIKYRLDVTPETNYTLSFFGKGGGGAAYKVLAADDEAQITEDYTGNHEDWHQYTVDFNSGENDAIIIYVSDTADTSYYDDFSIEQVLPNMIENGGFEYGDLTGWDTSGNSKFTVTDEEAHSGDYALEVSGPQDWNGIKYRLDVRPETDYTLSFYGKGGGGAAYKILAANDEAQITEDYTGNHEDWHQYTVDFNSGENDAIIIYISDAGQTAYYDDFYIGDSSINDPVEIPEASNVTISGDAKVTKQLTGSYDYYHPEDVEEGSTIYDWLHSDTEDGEYKSILRASGKVFSPNKDVIGHYIKLQITPVDVNGNRGVPVLSDAVGPVIESDVVDELLYKINIAKGIYEASETGTKPAQYPEDAYNEFGQVISKAEDVAEDLTSTEEDIQSQIVNLELAMAEFDKTRIQMTSPFNNFITTEGTKIMDGDSEFRFVSYNVPGALYNEDEDIMPTIFEMEDFLRTINQVGGKVFRTYSLTVKDKDDAPGTIRHITGPGEINDEAFIYMDKLLQLANEHELRVIIPFIDNWDWPPGGITDFAYFRGKDRMDFYTDPQLIEDFKMVIDKVMNRVNTFTGVKYKDDPAILGWETGNELMTAPDWMSEIAAHYKSINENQLLISGNQMELPHYYRNITEEALTDPNIDIVKSHYYEGNYANKVKEDKALATKYGKPFFVGEFGFKPTIEMKGMLEEVIEGGTSGALVWSLRPHSYNGGFVRHSEYEVDGILYRAYHWPGMPSGDYQDATNLIHLLRDKAYEIQGEDVPALPVPEPAPELLETDSITEFKWRGSTGASSYVIERSGSENGPWEVIDEGILDDVEPGENMYSDVTAISENEYFYRVKGVNSSGESGYSNIIGPITAKYTLSDSLEDNSKQYYYEDDSVVYRTPSSILAFEINTEVDGFTFYLSADGINYTEVFPVKSGTQYKLTDIEIEGADHLKIVYPDGYNDEELSSVEIEYYGDGTVLKPIKPLMDSGVLVDNMGDFSNIFHHSDNLSTESDAADPDAPKLIRTDNEDGYITYRTLGDITALKLETYNDSKPTEKEHFSVYVSSDGEDYEKVDIEVIDLGGELYKTNYQIQNLTDGIKFLKIEYPTSVDNLEFPQIGKVQIAVGSGQISFPGEPSIHVIDEGEHYGGESLLLEKDYFIDSNGGDINLHLDSEVKNDGDYSLKLDFQMDSHSFVGISKNLNVVDRSAFDTLQFWIKPDGYTRKLTLKLETELNEIWSTNVSIEGNEGSFVNIPINRFKSESSTSDNLDMDRISAFYLEVHKEEGPSNGTINLDNIRFVQTRVIDSFDLYDDESVFSKRYGTINTGGGLITATLSDEHKESGTHSMRLDYDLTGPGYAGIITDLPHVDWSAYDAVRLWTKPGDTSVELTIQVKTGANETMEATRLLEGGADPEFIDIPFEEFDYPSWYGGTGTLDPSEIIEFNIYMGLEGDPIGTIYLDSIELIGDSDGDGDQDPGDSDGDGDQDPGDGDGNGDPDPGDGGGDGDQDPGDSDGDVDQDAGDDDDNGDQDPSSGNGDTESSDNGGVSLDDGDDPKSEEKDSDNEMPKTATNMYTLLLIGIVMILLSGVFIYISKKKRLNV